MHLFSIKKVQISILTILSIMFIYPLLLVDTLALKTPETQKSSEEEVREQIGKAVDLINKGLYQDAERILLNFKDNILWQGKVFFLLGRLYKEEGSFEKAEDYLLKASVSYPLLRDYALKLLTEIYLTTEEFDKAIKTARQIKNRILQQEARKTEIRALLALEKRDEAARVLSQYVIDYPLDWEIKFAFASLLKEMGKTEKAIDMFKEIYIGASPLSAEALEELKKLKADEFTKEEILKRADNLFAGNYFQEAELVYKKLLPMTEKGKQGDIQFAIGRCQFSLRRYKDAAKTFGGIITPEALYWQARALYRADDAEGFKEIIKRFEELYSRDKYLADLLFILADDLRRKGDICGSEGVLKKILKIFPQKTEEVFWEMGWLNYISGNYERAFEYFSKLIEFKKSKDYYKYLYWKARSLEELAQKIGEFQERGKVFFDNLPSDESYYGYLIKLHSSSVITSDNKIQLPEVGKPRGETFERVDALAFLGMRAEAISEIRAALRKIRSKKEFLYLGYMAMKLQEYKSIVAIAESSEDRIFLPFSYPLAYWDIVRAIAEKEGIDPYLLLALIREESRFDPLAVSQAGAVGLMQLMPSTAFRFKNIIKINLNNTSELYDVTNNILLGTHYLSRLIKEFKKIPLALAAYNAGENALKKWLEKAGNKDLDEFIEDIPYKETRRYVKKVLRSYWKYRLINGLPISGP